MLTHATKTDSPAKRRIVYMSPLVPKQGLFKGGSGVHNVFRIPLLYASDAVTVL